MEIADMENQCSDDYDEILPGRYVIEDVTSFLCHNRLTGLYHHCSGLFIHTIYHSDDLLMSFNHWIHQLNQHRLYSQVSLRPP